MEQGSHISRSERRKINTTLETQTTGSRTRPSKAKELDRTHWYLTARTGWISQMIASGPLRHRQLLEKQEFDRRRYRYISIAEIRGVELRLLSPMVWGEVLERQRDCLRITSTLVEPEYDQYPDSIRANRHATARNRFKNNARCPPP